MQTNLSKINEELEIEIQDFFEISKDGGVYEIETPQGWVEIGDLVLKKNKKCYIIRTESGLELGGSEDHYVYTKRGWEPLKDINVEDSYVYTKDGIDAIVAKEYIGIEDTYDLEVKNDEHKYYANSIVSHNTGKTLICKILAKETPATILYVLPSHIKNIADIPRICKMAKDLAPTLMIIEDIDFIAEDREGSGDWSVVEFMNHMDGLEDFNNVVTLATTNMMDKVEKAIKNRPGRFDRIVNIPLPDTEVREKMFQTFCRDFKLDNVDIKDIAFKTDKLTGAYIKDLCITAALIAIQSKSITKAGKAIIKTKHFDEALDEIKNKDFTRLAETGFNKKAMGFSAPV